MTTTIRSPRVSVFIPAFNAERFIAEAIESILAQTYTDFELLIIDDGSTDATTTIIDEYTGDPRVRTAHNSRNHALPFTRNKGLELARGEYIALLDADDLVVPERLQKQVNFLDANRNVSVVATLRRKLDEHATPKRSSDKREFRTHDDILTHSLFRCPIHQPTVMGHTQSLRDYGYASSFTSAQDYDLWSRMLERHRFAVLPERLTFYRQHQNQISKTRKSSTRTHWQTIQKRHLDALGVEFDADDLFYHGLLHGGRNMLRAATGRDMDREYVSWARQWLDKLVAANAVNGIYPEPAFSRTVADYWMIVRRKALKFVGPAFLARESTQFSLKWTVPTGYFRGALKFRP